MTRPDKPKLLYMLVLLVLVGISVAIGWHFSFQPHALILLPFLLFIPGRIPELLWREFYTGQRLMRLGDHERAAASFEAFLDKLRSRPWLKRLVYFKWGFHTWDIEAMTLNNLGSTFVERGEPEQAIRWYEAAIAVDPYYGVPYANLAVIRYAEGNEAEAQRMLDQAHTLGNRHLTHKAAKERAAMLRMMPGSKR